MGWDNLQAGLGCLEQWATDWRMTFSPHKTVLMWIHRLRPTSCGPVPTVQFCGHPLEPVSTMTYLGVVIDSELRWSHHIQSACNRARRRLHVIRRVCGMYWGAHPQIVRQLVVGAVLPTLYFTAPIWAAASRQPHRMTDIERVLAAAGRLVCGLGRHAPGEGALALAGFRHPALELRSRLAGFWARMAAYGVNVRDFSPPCATGRSTPPRVDTAHDVLEWDLARLERGGKLPADLFGTAPAIERRALCPFAPWRARLPVEVQMAPREVAMDAFQRSRATSTPATVWVVTDGSVLPEGARAAALIYRGNGASPFA